MKLGLDELGLVTGPIGLARGLLMYISMHLQIK